MIRAALYARYSSDRQNERSVSDQVALLSRHAEAKGWTVARVFSDAAISGQAMANRPGLLDAVAAAERREYEILLTEDEDRIARNLEHQAHVFNRLRAAGVAIATLSSERIGLMEVAFKGLMAQQYVEVLGQKTRRGMRANAELGLATGSRLYGYQTQPGGQTAIVPAEAEVIREICARYGSGETARQIAADLNARAVPGPRGGAWNASTINGSPQRGNGVLNTELYAGVKVFGRLDVKKDMATGKRLSHLKPRDAWRRTPVPDLRIVDPGAWSAVRARKDRETGLKPGQLRRRPGLLSGLLKCGCCGASYTVYTGGKLICAAYRERGETACGNRRTPARAGIERRVLDGLKDQLLSSAAMAAWVAEHRAAVSQRKAELTSRRAPLEKRLAEIGRAVERIIDAIVEGHATDAMKARMHALEAERGAVTADLAEADAEPQVIELHPNAPALFAAMVDQLKDTLDKYGQGETPAQRELVEAIRVLIVKVVVTPTSQARKAPVDVKLHGRLAIFLQGCDQSAGDLRSLALVAGGGIVRWRPSFEACIDL